MYSDIEAVRQVILRLLNEKGMTINRLATCSGLTQSTLDSILKGKSKNPKIQTMQKIASGLDMPYDEFVRLVRGTEKDMNPDDEPKMKYDTSLPYNDKAILTASKKLKAIRLSKGISAYDVMKSTDAPVEYEQGQFGWRPLDTLIALADYFDVSLDYLVGRSDDPTRH